MEVTRRLEDLARIGIRIQGLGLGAWFSIYASFAPQEKA